MGTERHLDCLVEAERFLGSPTWHSTKHYRELPEISVDDLQRCLVRLRMSDVQHAIRYHILPIGWFPGVEIYAACSPRGFDHGQEQGLKIIARANTLNFNKAINDIWGERLLTRATNLLRDQYSSFSAYRRLNIPQIICLSFVAFSVSAFMRVISTQMIWALMSFLFAIFFLCMISLKLACLLSQTDPSRTKRSTPPRHHDELPVYSILVPLFQEVSVLRQLLRGLSALNYPADKLDIKIIVEAGDIPVRRALMRYHLPENYEIIIVPRGAPQTKPRALNYGLQFCRGELLTIYDAEDIPDPDQLLLCAAKFHESPDDVACLQAHLTFYNTTENWITQQFTAEYAVLFDIVLPVLSEKSLPLPLGGTSNHFRVNILRSIGGWDPHNVTEDADLGFRLARLGYRTGVVHSRTYEEAVNDVSNWLWQRARWLKGFLHTWLVHTRTPVKTIQMMGLGGFFIFTAMSLSVFISALLHPVLMAVSLLALAQSFIISSEPSLTSQVLSGISLTVFILGYAVAILTEVKAMRRLGIRHALHGLIYLPLYWLMMSAGAWLALYQFITTPHSWNKTEHGLSKLQQNKSQLCNTKRCDETIN